MEKVEKNPKLIPTPPSSAKPKSKTRSSSIKRRLALSRSSDSDTPKVTEENDCNGQSTELDPLLRQLSFSKYDIIPPINDKKQPNVVSDNVPKKAVKGDVSCGKSKEILGNAEGGKTRRMLYRKGDIFRRGNSNSLDEISCTEHASDANAKSKENSVGFCFPEEPLNDQDGRIYIAFRSPQGKRLCRYFLPTDRIGDVLVYLHDALNASEEIERFSLFTSEVPTRKLDELNTSLVEQGIKDRMVLNLIIDEPK